MEWISLGIMIGIAIGIAHRIIEKRRFKKEWQESNRLAMEQYHKIMAEHDRKAKL